MGAVKLVADMYVHMTDILRDIHECQAKFDLRAPKP